MALGKGGKEIALRQRLIGLGIVQFKWPVRGQDQHRCASKCGFYHGRQIVTAAVPEVHMRQGSTPPFAAPLRPEGGAVRR